MPSSSKKTPSRKPRATKPRAGKAPAAKPRRVVRSRSRVLLLIDNEPIRQGAIAEYYRVEQEISLAREQIEAFEAGDLPAYQRWEARLFGPLLTELRTALQSLEEKRNLLLEIEDEMFWGRCGPVVAYRRVMERRESPSPKPGSEEWQQGEETPEPDEPDWEGDRMFGKSDLPPDFDIDEFDRLSARKQQGFRREYRMMSMVYEMMTGRKAPDLEELLERERAQRGRGKARASSEQSETQEPVEPKIDRPADRLKELYRKLVRQLHPDSAKEQTPRERELWHEVQEVYKARDLERMEAVAGRIEMGAGGTAPNLPIQILRRMTQDLLDALRGLHFQITASRKHPAWNFRQKGRQLAKMEAKHRRTLTAELRRVNAQLELVTEDLDRLAAEASAPRRRKSRKKRLDQVEDEFPFF